MKRDETSFEIYPNGTRDIHYPPSGNSSKYQKNFHAVDKDGLPFVGAELVRGDVIINKFVPENTNEDAHSNQEMKYKKSLVCYKGSVPSYVDRVLLTSNLNGEDPKVHNKNIIH